MDDRERLTPISLAAKQPVTHFIVYRSIAQVVFLQPGNDGFDALLFVQTLMLIPVVSLAELMYSPSSVSTFCQQPPMPYVPQLLLLGQGCR